MNKSQIKVFKEMIADPAYKSSRKMLEWLLWRYTTIPKHKIGESFKVTDNGHRVYGYAVKDFNATITNITCFVPERVWKYELEAVCKFESKETHIKIYTDETEMKVKCADNINILSGVK